jgi:hypothetical protein
MNETQPPDNTQPLPTDTSPPQPKRRGHKPGVKTKRRIDPRNPRAVQMANRLNACKMAQTTRHAADVALAKTKLASLFADVGGKCLEILRGLDEEQLRELARTKPVQLAIISGICGQNLERLTIKQPAPPSNFDLRALSEILKAEREREAQRCALKRELEELKAAPVIQEAIITPSEPTTAVDVPADGEPKTLAAGSESAEGQAKA